MTDLIRGIIYTFGSSSALSIDVKYEKKREGSNMLYRFYYKIFISNRSGNPYSYGNYSNNLKATFKLNNTDVWIKEVQSSINGWSFEYTSDWFTVANKIDGTTPFILTIKDTQNAGWCNYTSATNQLPIDPAGSDLLTVSNFNIGQNFVVNLKKYSTTMYDVLKIKIGNTVIKTIENVGTNNTIIFTSSELNSIYGLTINDPSKLFTFELTTYENSSKTVVVGVPKTETATGYIVNSNPTKFNEEVYDLNATTRNLTGNTAIVVLNASNVRFCIGATPQNQATISGVFINGKQATYENSSGKYVCDFNKCNTNSFDYKIVDSRGFKLEGTFVAEKIDYIELTINVNLERNAPTDDKAKINYSGNYFNGIFGIENNTLQVSYRSRCITDNEEFTNNWLPLMPVISNNNTYSQEVIIEGYDYQKRYEFEIKAEDEINIRPVIEIPLLKGDSIANWNDEKFNVNGYLTVRDYINSKEIVSTNIVKIPVNGASGYGLVNANGISIIRSHSNNNVTVDATGGTLFLGNKNTTAINILNGKANVDSAGNISAPNISRLGHYIECDYSRHTQNFSAWSGATITGLTQRRINGDTLSRNGNSIKANKPCKVLILANLSVSSNVGGDIVIDILLNNSSVSAVYKTSANVWNTLTDFAVINMNTNDNVSLKFTAGISGNFEFLDQSSLIAIVLNS